jgi:hypothetical protein
VPYSVIIGRLRSVEDGAIEIGGGLRLLVSPGVAIADVPVGTSLTITAVSRDGLTYAERSSQRRRADCSPARTE